jgi:gamma-glutamyltranspeptidase/glutathione hydrolase
MKSPRLTRRRFLQGTGAVCAAALVSPVWMRAALRPSSEQGYVVGELGIEDVGARILAGGGNAVDALVATALAGAVTQPHQTGIGGYGTHAVFAFDGGKRIAALDANSMAPAAFTADIFKPDGSGQVPGRKNHHGWLAAGVPGVIAGLKLALDQFGTMRFSDVLQPAIGLTRDGFVVTPALAGVFSRSAANLRKDPGSARLYLPGGAAPKAGETWRNPALAEVLVTLAKAESIEPFYRGAIARRIAEAFAKNGGLVTAQDLGAYQARMVEPLAFTWGGRTIHTAPLTCGGLTVLQMLATLKAMGWDRMSGEVARTHARIEAMRFAWRDRLELLGDPEFGPIPQERLLSANYAGECAERIRAAVQAGRVLDHGIKTASQGGTLSFSACDRHGNVAALTLTHGESFGAQVTVDDLGLTLGHGMSRFDPRPDHPNAPGPRKRPLHNMAPVVITDAGRPVVAIGGRGGRKIPNAIFDFLINYVAEKKPFAAALAAHRLHTEGATTVEFQKTWPAATTDALAKLGYAMKPGGSATLSGVALEGGRWLAGMQ